MSDQPRLLGGRYEVGELIGRGGMAEVHVGHDTRLGRAVAIKMLRSDLARDATFLQRFRREAQSAAGLNHPNIVSTFDSGEDTMVEAGGAEVAMPYIVMEYVEGQTLRALLNAQGHIDPTEASRVTEALLDALAYSHSRGIVHRDIKPANVMIATDGSVKVMDFGIARAVADTSATMTHTQAVIGTAQYLSPEQAQGRTVDHRSDLYSAGCLLFELLTGRPPFMGDSPVAIAYQHVSEPPPRPSALGDGIARDLDAVVLHALAKDLEARYQSADDFRRDLAASRLGRPISREARGALTAATGMPGAHRAGAGAVGAAAAGGAAGAAAGLGAGTASAGTPPTAVVAGSGAGASQARRVVDPVDDDTSSMDPVRDRDRDRRPGLMILLALTALAALILLGLAGKNLLDQRAADNAKVQVPSLATFTEAEAQDALTRAGLRAEVVHKNSSAQEGRVFDQDPAAGTPVSRNSPVTVVVSDGPAQVSVPDVTGFEEDAARTALEQVDLVVSAIQMVNDSEQPAGRVASTSPAKDKKVARRSKVVLRVSTGKVTVPDVTGMDAAKARSTLLDKGFRTKSVSQESTRPEGTVLDQSPGNGKVVERGSVVEIVVASPPTATKTTIVTETQSPTSSSTTTPTPSPTATSPTPSPTGTFGPTGTTSPTSPPSGSTPPETPPTP